MKVYRTVRHPESTSSLDAAGGGSGEGGGDAGLLFMSRGEYQAEFLTVEHDTGLRLHEEVILRRQESAKSRTNMTMYAMIVDELIGKQKVAIYFILDYKY